MATLELSKPTIISLANLTADPTLLNQVTNFMNATFRRVKTDPTKYDQTVPRFRSPANTLEMLGDNGIMCATFDDGTEDLTAGPGYRRIVACAAVVPWAGGLFDEGHEDEEGWEIKAACVEGDVKYAKRGLMVDVVECIKTHLIHIQCKEKKDKMRIDNEDHDRETRGTLNLWIQAVASLNGNGLYWRRRGFTFVRSDTVQPGTFGFKTVIEMEVLRMVVDI